MEILAKDCKDRVLLTTDDDDVLDYINKFPNDYKIEALKALDADKEKDTVIIFRTEENIFGIIYKFGAENDSGLIAAISMDRDMLSQFGYTYFKDVNLDSAEQIVEELAKQ